MTTLVAHAVFQPPLVALELRLEPGLFVFAGRSSDGTGELCRVFAGATRPVRGTLRIGDRDPYADAGIRRSIACLLPEETLPPGPNVGASIERALELRGQSASASSVLAPFGLDGMTSRDVRELPPCDTRRLALALALVHPTPSLVVLHEPLTAAAAYREQVLRSIAELAENAIVVCTTESSSSAAELCVARRPGLVPVLLGLRDGRLAQPLDRSAAGWSPSARASFAIRCSDPAKLAATLSSDPAVTACEWDLERLPGELGVSGVGAEATMTAVLLARRQSGVAVSAITRRESWR